MGRRNRPVFARRDVIKGASAAIIAGAAPRSAWARTEADVIVIGAGLAGLFAAHKLEVAGLRTIVVEGERRVGGRLFSLNDVPGKPDAGGILVGAGYKRLRSIADDLKVPLLPSSSDGTGSLFRINGVSVTAADWATSPANWLIGDERKILPSALGNHYNAMLPRLDSVTDWMLAGAQADVPYNVYLKQSDASDEAQRLIEANLNGNSLASLSTLHIARSAAIFRAGAGPASTIGGGSQTLPAAMAANLKSTIRLGQIVRRIEEGPDSVIVTFASGHSVHAKHVICTIPFSALRTLSVEGNIDPSLSALIPALPYTRATFAYLSASEPFWKSDGLPETIWSDDPLIGRIFALGTDPPMLKVWLSGANADRLDHMVQETAGAEIIARIAAARPSSKGKLSLAKIWSWQNNPMARGIYHHIAPGQGIQLGEAARAQGKRLHFAGEHLAWASSGMEGALESGERAANHVIAHP
jgi:monoamine oxidase